MKEIMKTRECHESPNNFAKQTHSFYEMAQIGHVFRFCRLLFVKSFIECNLFRHVHCPLSMNNNFKWLSTFRIQRFHRHSDSIAERNDILFALPTPICSKYVKMIFRAIEFVSKWKDFVPCVNVTMHFVSNNLRLIDMYRVRQNRK